jgi:uncharacterized protein
MNLSGHIETIVPALFRKHKADDFFAEEIPTPDGDFLEMDWYRQDSGKLVILSHGLEGNSKRPYMTGMAKSFFTAGFDCLLWNFRSCGSRMNDKTIMYHSGASYDLDTIIQYAISKGYQEISLVGFSLGGNLTLKYLGERGAEVNPTIKNAAVFSVPCHLSAGAAEIDKWFNKVYCRRFLKSLKAKMHEKASKHLEIKQRLHLLENIKTLKDFDEYFTAPIHGFKDAEDYYHQNSSIHFIENIKVKTLIVNAKNDPFLPTECYPIKEAGLNPNLILEIPEKGGHCGFSISGGIYWSELRALEFIAGNV